MKRIFAGLKIEPGDNLLSMYSNLVSVMEKEQIKWVDPENLHITLAFLGNTDNERIKIAGQVLKQKSTGFGEFDFVLSGSGVFKSWNHPTVIWTGIETSEELSRLNRLIVTGLQDTGFSLESRPFKPHITIGRIRSLKNPDVLRSAVENYQHFRIQIVHADAVILYESIIKNTGPVYKPLGIFRLG